jgi:hypothetical protein
MPTILNTATKTEIINTVQALEDIFIGNGETVRSIFNHHTIGSNGSNMLSTTQIAEKKACIKFIICILDTIHDFNSSSNVMKEWVKWMMSSGGKIGSIAIEGDPNNLWNNSSIPLTDKYNIIQTMVSHPEDVALYFVFGWGTSKLITEIGHEYRFEYYANKSLTNYEGYKAFFMAHQNKYNNDWICNELVKKQKIFVKNNGTNTNYKYYEGTTPKFIENGKEQTQGPSFMIDHGCPNFILNAFTLDQINEAFMKTQLIGTGVDPVFGTIPANKEFNCAQYTGIAKNYDMGFIKNISYYCDDTTIRHNHTEADATTASLFFEITDYDKSKIQYIDPDPKNAITTTVTLPNNATGKKGLKNTLRFLISQYNSSASTGATFFTLAKGTVKKAFIITFNAFKKALLPNLWKPSVTQTDLWKKLSINYDLKRNGDWNQSIDCLRKDSDCTGSGWEETVFMTHDGIAAAISAVIVGVNTIWVWKEAGNRTECTSVYIPRCDTSIPLPTISTNTADISEPISNFIDVIETQYGQPNMIGGKPIVIKYINSNPVTKQKLIECLYDLCSISSINHNIIQPLQTGMSVNMKALLCNTYISNYDWDIITNPKNNETIINFYDENYGNYERSLIKCFKDKRSIGDYLTKKLKNNKNNGNTTKAQEREFLERRSRALITDVQNRRAAQINLLRGINGINGINGNNNVKRPPVKSTIVGGQQRKMIGYLIKEALIKFYEKYENIDDKDKGNYIDKIYTTLLYNLLNYKLNGIKIGSDEYICHIIGIILEENIQDIIKLNVPYIDWSKIEEIIEVNDDNELVNDINNIINKKKFFFLKKLNKELTYSFNESKNSSKSKNLNLDKYLKKGFDELLNEFKYNISYIVDIILSTKKYKVSDEKAIQVLKIIDTIIINGDINKEKALKKVITNTKPSQNNKIKEYVPSSHKKLRNDNIKIATNKKITRLKKSKLILSKPTINTMNKNKYKMSKKTPNMLKLTEKSKKDKYKLRIEQFKNKNISAYFEKKINSHINNKGVNIYDIDMKRMKGILKEIYKIEK